MDDPARDLKVSEVIAKLRLKPGDIVADIGSGAGSFSIPMAKAIAHATAGIADDDFVVGDVVILTGGAKLT